MRLIHPSFEIYEQGPGLEGIYEAIELAGRTCYKSTRPEGQTAKDFVDRMIASKHYAMLEHGTVYLYIPGTTLNAHYTKFYWNYGGDKSPYLKSVYINGKDGPEGYYITTNYRYLLENNLLEDLKYLCEPTEFHEKRVTVRFTTDRGVSHEFVRHRVFSFAQESTRYCNYSKDKFGNELSFIMPSWCNMEEGDYGKRGFNIVKNRGKFNGIFASFVDSLRIAEDYYLHLVKDGWTPQQARQVLPNALKTELVMTGFVSDWQHFFRLRTSILAETGKPHPDASALADPLYKEFIDRGYMESLV